MVGFVCSYRNCTNTHYKNRDVRFFNFPRDQKIRQEWFIAAGRLDLQDAQKIQSYRICSEHFTEDMFMFNRKRLLPLAVPEAWNKNEVFGSTFIQFISPMEKHAINKFLNAENEKRFLSSEPEEVVDIKPDIGTEETAFFYEDSFVKTLEVPSRIKCEIKEELSEEECIKLEGTDEIDDFGPECQSNIDEDTSGSNQPIIYKCQYCNHSSTQLSLLENHINAVHLKLKMYRCKLCDYSSTLMEYLKDHINVVHLELKKYKCGYCNHYTSGYKDLEDHIYAIHRKVRM